MDNYTFENNDTRSRLYGVTAVVAYFLIISLMTLITIRINKSHDTTLHEGIMLDFGDGDTGWGDTDLPLSGGRVIAASMPDDDGSVFATQDFEDDAPSVATQPERQTRPTERTTAQPTQTAPAVVQPQVDQPSLFPGETAGNSSSTAAGRTVGSTATSEGTAGGTGNQGSPQGSPGGSHNGTGGTGTSGTAQLPGRQVFGFLPKPAYNSNEEGRVVVSITVDNKGNVTSASYRAQGSTTQAKKLVDEALSAARKAKFSEAETEGLQSGTITYIFKLQ